MPDAPAARASTLSRLLHHGLFFGPMAMQAFVTLFSIPVMVSQIGEEEWGRIATGQSVGLFGGTLLALGWGITGPAMIAAAKSDDEKTSILFISFYTKAVVTLPVALGAAVVTWQVVNQDVVVSVLAAWSTTAMGFAATWFFVGNADPIGMILYDALPRSAVSFVGWLLVSLGLPVWAGLTIQLGATLGTSVLCIFAVRRKLGRPSRTYMRARLPSVVREQMAPVSTAIVLTLFGAAPLVVANLVHVLPLAPLAIVDKLGKQLTTGFVPMGNILLAKSSEKHSELSDQTRGLRKHVVSDYLALQVLTAVIAVIAILVAPLLIHVLGTAQIDVPWSMIIFTGLATGLAVQGALMSPLCLAFLGRVRAGRDAAAVGSVIGIGAMFALGIPFGGVGISAAVFVGCLGIVVAQGIILFRSP